MVSVTTIIFLTVVFSLIGFIIYINITKPLVSNCYCQEPASYQRCTPGTEPGSAKCQKIQDDYERFKKTSSNVYGSSQKIIQKTPELPPTIPPAELPRAEPSETLFNPLNPPYSPFNDINYSCRIDPSDLGELVIQGLKAAYDLAKGEVEEGIRQLEDAAAQGSEFANEMLDELVENGPIGVAENLAGKGHDLAIRKLDHLSKYTKPGEAVKAFTNPTKAMHEFMGTNNLPVIRHLVNIGDIAAAEKLLDIADSVPGAKQALDGIRSATNVLPLKNLANLGDLDATKQLKNLGDRIPGARAALDAISHNNIPVLSNLANIGDIASINKLLDMSKTIPGAGQAINALQNVPGLSHLTNLGNLGAAGKLVGMAGKIPGASEALGAITQHANPIALVNLGINNFGPAIGKLGELGRIGDLSNLASRGIGEAGKQLVNMGEQGVEAAKEAVNALRDAGGVAAETINAAADALGVDLDDVFGSLDPTDW